MHKTAVWIVAALACAGVAAAAEPAVFRHPLDMAAPVNTQSTGTQVSAIARAGERLVAVGVRGLVVYSDDAGVRWTQATVPVSSDLLAVHFPSPRVGWAVGHSGVVLATRDGGESWEKQFDGRQAKQLLLDHYRQRAADGDEAAQRQIEDVGFTYANGPEQALLGVWFLNDREGFVCGSFGTLFATGDGGTTWVPWHDRVDSAQAVHLNAIRGIGGRVFIASEKGVVFRLDRGTDRFVAMETGYTGSYFALAGQGDAVVAFGLRGNAFRSTDGGGTWHHLATGVSANFTGADVSADGRMLIVTQSGQLLVSASRGDTFQPVPVPFPTLFSGVAQIDATTAVAVGLGGIVRIPLK